MHNAPWLPSGTAHRSIVAQACTPCSHRAISPRPHRCCRFAGSPKRLRAFAPIAHNCAFGRRNWHWTAIFTIPLGSYKAAGSCCRLAPWPQSLACSPRAAARPHRRSAPPGERRYDAAIAAGSRMFPALAVGSHYPASPICPDSRPHVWERGSARRKRTAKWCASLDSLEIGFRSIRARRRPLLAAAHKRISAASVSGSTQTEGAWSVTQTS